MPIEVSMYNQPQNQLQPVDMATKYIGLQSAINQNKMFPGQMQMQKQGIKQGQQAIESGQIGIDQARMEHRVKQMDILNNTLASLATKPDVSQADVVAAAKDMVRREVITPDMFSSTMKGMPQDPAQLKDYLEQTLTRTLSAQEKMIMAFGSPQLVNTGQGLVGKSISPTKGVRDLPGDRIRVMPSESEMNQPTVIGRDERGRPIMGTMRQFQQNATGVDPITQKPVAPPAGAQVASNDPNIGAAPAPGGGPAGDMGRVPGGGVVTTMAPGEEATMQASAKAWQDARQYVAGDGATPNGSAQRMLSLSKALEGLQNAPETGPGSETLNQMRSFILTVAPTAGKMAGIDPEQVASYDEANKYLTAYASQAAGASGSDSRLASALSGNASTHISNLAAQDVVKASMALERSKMAQVAIFQSMGGRPEEFADWAAETNRKIDPRAFAVDLMDVDKRKKMLGAMGAADKKKFMDSVRIGIAAGVIDPASLGGAAGGQ